MPSHPRPEGVSQPRGRSTRRVELARVALSAIRQVPEVVPTAGPDLRWRTFDGDRALDGVVAIEGGEGVDLGLHLNAVWPPPALTGLAERVRLNVARGALEAELDAGLGDVEVLFHDVVLRSDAAVAQ